MLWDKISDIILVAAIMVLGVFTILGLVQLISRKSIEKVDRPILAFIPSIILMAIVYIIFDHFIILNTRPNGSGEPSFPSTHVMIVTTIFLITAIAISYYIKSKSTRIIIDILMLILLILVCMGRIFSNMHWPLDVAGGILFGIIFAEIYLLILKPKQKSKKKKNE